jgi:hypothetical protein
MHESGIRRSIVELRNQLLRVRETLNFSWFDGQGRSFLSTVRRRCWVELRPDLTIVARSQSGGVSMPGRIASVGCLEQEPGAPLSLVNPNFDEAGRGRIEGLEVRGQVA